MTSLQPVPDPIIAMRETGMTEQQIQAFWRKMLPNAALLNTAQSTVAEFIDRISGNGLTADHAWGWAKRLETHVESLLWLEPIIARLYAGGIPHAQSVELATGIAPKLQENAPAESEQPYIDTIAVDVSDRRLPQTNEPSTPNEQPFLGEQPQSPRQGANIPSPNESGIPRPPMSPSNPNRGQPE